MNIVHVWDQCGYAANITSKVSIPNVNFSNLGRLPEFGMLSKPFGVNSRFSSNIYEKYLFYSISKLKKTNCIFEVHTPHFYRYFPELVDRTIFHAHGSEIRETILGGVNINRVDEKTKFALENSIATFYSTPELGTTISRYTKNLYWTPHFLNLNENSNRSVFSEIDLFFPSSWEVWKGAIEVLDLIKRIKLMLPNLRVHGLAFGTLQEDAVSAGVYLHSTKARHRFHTLLKKSRIVLGQGYGTIGASDLEALALNSNYFPFSPTLEWYDAYHFDRQDFPNRDDLENELVVALESDNKYFERYKKKVLIQHQIETLSTSLRNAYRESLS